MEHALGRPNFENDKYFLDLVNTGVLSITDTNTVRNNITNREIGYTTNKGYRAIGIKVGNKTKHMLVHRLILLVNGYSFSDTFPIANHISGDKINNEISLLELSNYSNNAIHAFETGLRISHKPFGNIPTNRKLSFEQAEEIRVLYSTGKHTQRALAQKYGVVHSQIGHIIRGETYFIRNGESSKGRT